MDTGVKTIGIISEFNKTNVNFGNRLQAFALNKYLLDNYSDCRVEYLFFEGKEKIHITKKRNFVEQCMRIKNGLYRRILKQRGCFKGYEVRLAKCNMFSTENMSLRDRAYTYEELSESKYDIIIVGSDIVWSQWPFGIRSIKFLDFVTEKPFSRVAYAASFGRDWIPKENIYDIQRCLRKFSAISVRESSSVGMLNDIGVTAIHALDPTLLLEVEEYQRLEEVPEMIDEIVGKTTSYIFTYLLGTDTEMRKQIVNWAKVNGYTIVTIPYANGMANSADTSYGDIKIVDCSPGNFLWLIHHAEYVITDSFHGIVFSTIYEKKFVVLARKMSIDINNRMVDFLKIINQEDKMLSCVDLEKVGAMEWDYKLIYSLLEKKKRFSKEFLDAVVG